MKKRIFLTSLLLALLLGITSPAQAALKTIRIPTIIQVTAESIQKSIDMLIGRTNDHDNRIIELEKKVKVLEERVAKLETNTLINDENSNIQPTQGLKETNEPIPLNQLQQDSSGLIQKIGEFISNSSSQLSPADIIGPGVIDLNSSIKP